MSSIQTRSVPSADQEALLPHACVVAAFVDADASFALVVYKPSLVLKL